LKGEPNKCEISKGFQHKS